MADTVPNPIVAALWRLLRTGVAMGLPVLISWLSGHPNVYLAALGPVINAIAKYLRDVFKWDWLPV